MGDQHRNPPQNILTRFTGEMAARFRAEGFWADDAVYTLAKRHAEANPGKRAIQDSYAALTYGELVGLAEQLAAELAGAGLRPGDRVAAWLSSRVETAVALIACSRNGYVFCPSLHKNHTVAEIAGLLARARAKALLAEEAYGADAKGGEILERARALQDMRRLFPLARPQKRTAADIARHLGLTRNDPPPPVARADDIVYLAFTSGTTGEPKGVMHSNNTLLANARAISLQWGFGPHSVLYAMGPLSHNLGFGALVMTMLNGGELVLHDGGASGSLLARLRKTGTTFAMGVPAHAIDLVKEIEAAGKADLPAFTGFRISGGAVGEGVVRALHRFGVRPVSGYGMTEAGSHHQTLPADPPERILGSLGRVCPGYEVKVFDPDEADRELPAGEVGQIGGRGASLMLGYYDDQKHTENAFNGDGWFMTGDLGSIDAGGYLTMTGRIKDIIKRGGHNIHPAHMEALAMRYPPVERAAAVAVGDERLGERVCIVVTSKTGGPIDPDKLIAHLKAEGLSRYDMPEFFLQVPEMPMTTGGKILKRGLLPLIQSGKYRPQPIRRQE